METEGSGRIGESADAGMPPNRAINGQRGLSLEVSYDYVLRTLVPLNHDRFKSYFNYFLILQIGLLTLIFVRGTDAIIEEADRESFTIGFAILGIASSLAWLAILVKITRDIRLAWKSAIYVEEALKPSLTLAKDYVEGSLKFEKWYFSVWRLLPASAVMTAFPAVFLAIYGLVLATIN